MSHSSTHTDQHCHHTIRDIPGLRGWMGRKGEVNFCIAVAFGSELHPERMDDDMSGIAIVNKISLPTFESCPCLYY